MLETKHDESPSRFAFKCTSCRYPETWSARPGQKAKQSKFMLYTDTYGPNYRYTTALPKYVDADGAVAAVAVAVLVQSRGGAAR